MATSWSLEADKRTGGRETTYYQTQQFSNSAGEPEPAPPLPWISESQNGFPGIILIYKIKKKKSQWQTTHYSLLLGQNETKKDIVLNKI